MSSYKTHTIFGILLALPLIPSFFYLFFALLGASIPDLDHENNTNKVLDMFMVGVVLSVLLLFFNGVYLGGLLLVLLALIFYVSKHRGFTHTLLGVFMLSSIFTLMVMGFLPTITFLGTYFGISFLPRNMILFITLAIVGYFVISRKILLMYLLVLGIYLIIIPVDYLTLNWTFVFLMFFIGALSHLILDLWTPHGIKLLLPVSDKTFHKKTALLLLLLWIVLSIYIFITNGSLLSQFIQLFMYT